MIKNFTLLYSKKFKSPIQVLKIKAASTANLFQFEKQTQKDQFFLNASYGEFDKRISNSLFQCIFNQQEKLSVRKVTFSKTTFSITTLSKT